MNIALLCICSCLFSGIKATEETIESADIVRDGTVEPVKDDVTGKEEGQDKVVPSGIEDKVSKDIDPTPAEPAVKEEVIEEESSSSSGAEDKIVNTEEVVSSALWSTLTVLAAMTISTVVFLMVAYFWESKEKKRSQCKESQKGEPPLTETSKKED